MNLARPVIQELLLASFGILRDPGQPLSEQVAAVDDRGRV
jgi:hypothetical protein